MDSYGKKNFKPPVTDIAALVGQNQKNALPVFIPDLASPDRAAAFISALIKKMNRIKLKMIVPEPLLSKWKRKYVNAELIAYKRCENGTITFSDKLRILKFLKVKGAWNLIISPVRPPRMATIWGRLVAKVNLEEGIVISIERLRVTDFLRIFLDTPVFLIRALLFPPEKEKSDY